MRSLAMLTVFLATTTLISSLPSNNNPSDKSEIAAGPLGSESKGSVRGRGGNTIEDLRRKMYGIPEVGAPGLKSYVDQIFEAQVNHQKALRKINSIEKKLRDTSLPKSKRWKLKLDLYNANVAVEVNETRDRLARVLLGDVPSLRETIAKALELPSLNEKDPALLGDMKRLLAVVESPRLDA